MRPASVAEVSALRNVVRHFDYLTRKEIPRILERVGFQREGYARSSLCIGGEWRDHLLYALLATDPLR